MRASSVVRALPLVLPSHESPVRALVAGDVPTPARGPEVLYRARPVPGLPFYDIDIQAQTTLEQILAGAASVFESMPVDIVSGVSALTARCILKETVKGGVFAYTAFGLTKDDKLALVPYLRDEFATRGMDLSVADGGRVVTVSAAGAKKGAALQNFAARIRMKADDVLKFGDQASFTGNDRTLLVGARAYNVGADVADVFSTKEKHAAGVLSVLDAYAAAGQPVRAIMSDFDGTLTVSNNRGSPLDPEMGRRLIELLNHGVKVGIATGRGCNITDVLAKPLAELGLGDKGLRHLTIYLFNGGLGLPAVELA